MQSYVIAFAAVKYLRARPQRQRERRTACTLGEACAQQRKRCGMTQEFVAQELGVRRQAVSKREKGASDPSTHNLIALAKLYEVDAADLLKAASTQWSKNISAAPTMPFHGKGARTARAPAVRNMHGIGARLRPRIR